jgi:hypothetical protein
MQATYPLATNHKFPLVHNLDILSQLPPRSFAAQPRGGLAYNLPQNIAVSVLTTKNAKSTKNVSNITNFSVFFAFFVVKIGFHLTLSQCFFAAKPRGWLSAFQLFSFRVFRVFRG